jgi:hypothetical protein
MATAIDPNFAGAATIPLGSLASQQAPGMQKDGPVFAGQFQDGQSLEQPVQLQPNKCYTVVAVGAGPQQLDLALVLTTPVPGMNPVLASGSGSSQAVLGAGNGCFHWQLPLAGQAKISMRASKGAGLAAAQLYSK